MRAYALCRPWCMCANDNEIERNIKLFFHIHKMSSAKKYSLPMLKQIMRDKQNQRSAYSHEQARNVREI